MLAGFEVPAEDEAAFEQFLVGLGYHYEREAENPAYQMFLKS